LTKAYMNLDVTYKYAVEKLAMKEPQEMARNAGVEYNHEGRVFTVDYLAEKYNVSYPDGEVKLAQKHGEVDLTVKILILHYLFTANGAPLQNRWISFKELPDGAIYIEPFTRRAIKPLVNLFAERQEDLVRLAKKLGGREENLGDTSVTINVFPRVPVTYVIWGGDDEFPATGNILFDASSPNYLPTEDYAVISGLVVYKLGKMLQSS